MKRARGAGRAFEESGTPLPVDYSAQGFSAAISGAIRGLAIGARTAQTAVPARSIRAQRNGRSRRRGKLLRRRLSSPAMRMDRP